MYKISDVIKIWNSNIEITTRIIFINGKKLYFFNESYIYIYNGNVTIYIDDKEETYLSCKIKKTTGLKLIIQKYKELLELNKTSINISLLSLIKKKLDIWKEAVTWYKNNSRVIYLIKKKFYS